MPPDGSPDSYRADPVPPVAAPGINLVRLRTRGWWVVFGCGVGAAMSLLAALAQGAALAEWGLPLSETWQAWLMGTEFFQVITAAMLATSLVWLFWVYTAAANLRAVSAPAMTWSPTAAVIWCLIPVANLVMQFFILRAIWQGTFSVTRPAPLLVSAWAASVWLPTIVILFPALQMGDLTAYNLTSEAVANLLQAVSLGLQAVMVRSLTQGQSQLTSVADTFA